MASTWDVFRAASFVEVHARVEGFLEKMLFEEGKRVKQNEPCYD